MPLFFVFECGVAAFFFTFTALYTWKLGMLWNTEIFHECENKPILILHLHPRKTEFYSTILGHADSLNDCNYCLSYLFLRKQHVS